VHRLDVRYEIAPTPYGVFSMSLHRYKVAAQHEFTSLPGGFLAIEVFAGRDGSPTMPLEDRVAAAFVATPEAPALTR
jgi:hypothetical protein